MPSKKLAGLTFAVALAALGPCAARAAEGQDSSGQQTEERRKAQEKKQGREKPASAAEQKAPLRFTDLDLERFHGRPIAPAEDEIDAEDEAVGVPGPGPQPPPGAGPRAPAPPAGVAGPRVARPVTRPSVRPPGLAPRPQDDPLKPFRDREAKEKFRAEQIQTMRDRIANLQTRLDYLNAKKNALQNPAPLLAGQTRGPSAPPTPIQGPGKVAIGGFFPPLPPPQTDEDRENDKKLKVKDLIVQVDKEIESVQEELEAARTELVSVETRFAQESQSR
ncbi:MAG: hypothetical protein HYS34_03950 [Acidobacteria bacterium]|nr:hypothetical protein [Acidobacteriota bacterium]